MKGGEWSSSLFSKRSAWVWRMRETNFLRHPDRKERYCIIHDLEVPLSPMNCTPILVVALGVSGGFGGCLCSNINLLQPRGCS